ncbi:glycosyltransferase family 4 protein [Deltaproteobacteria bacterium]|nr:glycosyltransferase family 4 protein [Deltaproteobacteria bacterium]
MKILMLTDVFFPDTIGGAGRVAHYLCFVLSKKGHEVHIITRNENGELPYYEKFNNNFFIHRFFLPQKESLSLLLKEVKSSYSLTRRLSREIAFDAICVHQSMVAIGPLLSGCLKGIPVIYYFHSPWHEEYLIKKRTEDGKLGIRDRVISFIMKKSEKKILRNSERIIVLSDYMGKKISQLHGYPQESIRIIPGGVDLDHFRLPLGGKTIAKQDLALPQDKTIFLTVRNLVPRMGLESLIEAFDRSAMLQKNGFLLIGGRGSLEDRLKKMVDSYNLKQSVRFLGYIPDVDLPGIYQSADFFVLPTKKLEGFGLVILEAMACGTPVLGTPVGAIPEVIGLFDERLIFEGTSWKDIKEKMENVIENPDRYQYQPGACRKFVEENFSWRKVADEFEKEAMKLLRR